MMAGNFFQRLSGTLQSLLPADATEEEVAMQNDRVAVVNTGDFTSIDQASVSIATRGYFTPEQLRTSVDKPSDIKDQGEKFYFLQNAEWQQSNELFQWLIDMDVVNELTSTNKFHAVTGLTEYHQYIRFGLEVQIQINPTPFQQGGLLAALIPYKDVRGSVTCYTCYPHCLLNCNVNNVGTIKVPYVYTRGRFDVDSPVYVPWRLIVMVWSQLYCASTTAAYVSIMVSGRFVDLELYGLRPPFAVESQMMRNEVRLSSSGSMVNLSNRSDSRAKVSLALGQEHSRPEPSVAGGARVRDLREWARTPTLFDYFDFNGSSPVGQLIKTYSVSPYLYHITDGKNKESRNTALCSIAQMFAYWRGDIVYHFQCFPTKFHSGRLLIAYIPGSEKTNVTNVNLRSATSAHAVVFDVNGVASTLVFRVPFVSDTTYRVNNYTQANNAKHQNSSIGKLKIYVYSRLTYPGSVIQHVRVNVYISAVNADFIAPLYSLVGHEGSLISQAGGLEETNKPEVQDSLPLDVGAVDKVPLGAVTTIEDPALEKKVPETFPEVPEGVLRHSRRHTDLYNFAGRGFLFTQFTFSKDKTVVSLPICIGADRGYKSMPSLLRWFFTLFHLYRGPLDLTFVFKGDTIVDGTIWFVPTAMAHNGVYEPTADTLTENFKASLGVIKFSTRLTQSVQVRVPWYHYCDAIESAGFVADGGDDEFGIVCMLVENYNSADEYQTVQVYLSLTEESEMYFMRAPMANSQIKGLGATGNYVEFEAQGPVELDMTEEEREELEQQSVRYYAEHGGRLYKELRLEIGERRVEYALTDWRKRREQGNRWLLQRKVKMQSQSATIEEYDLVRYRWKDVVFQGFVFNGEVIFLDCMPRSAMKVPFLKYGRFSTDKKEFWNPIGKKIPKELADKFVALGFHRSATWISFPKMMEKKFSEAFDSSDYKLLQQALCSGLEGFLSELVPLQMSMLDKVLGSSETVTEVTDVVKDVANECTTFMKKLTQAAKQIAIGLNRTKSRMICKVIMNLAKFALSMYICHNCDWDLKVCLPILIMQCMDGVDTGLTLADCLWKLTEDALRVAFDEKVSAQEMRTQSMDWLRNLVAGIAVFKAAKDAFKFVLEKVQDWYSKQYGEKKKKLELLEKTKEDVASLMTEVDNCLKGKTNETDKADESEKCVGYLQKLRTIQMMLVEDKEMGQLQNVVRDLIAKVQQHLSQLGVVNVPAVCRSEPTVVYLHGARGSGKSLAAMALAVKLCKALGVEYNKNIYTRPVDADFWDGYEGQRIVIMDDIGQNPDDKDWAYFCQLVSGCPLRLNMASLEEKGRHFVSPIIICTSNLSNPDPKTVYVKEAVLRRLHFKVSVAPKKYYSKDGVIRGLLDVEKAKKDNTISLMTCCEFRLEGDQETSQVSLQDLLQAVIARVNKSENNMEEFLQLWAQGASAYEDETAENFRKFLGSKVMPKPKYQLMLEYIKDHKVMILGGVLSLLAACGMIWGAVKLAKHFKQKPTSEAAYSGMPKPKAVVRLDQEKLESTSLVDISNLVRRNLVRFGVGDNEENPKWCLNALGVRGEWILVPQHAFRFDEKPPEFIFVERDGVFYCTPMSKVEVVSLEAGFADVVLMRIPHMPAFRDITDHFVRREDLEKCDGKVATLCTVNCGLYQLITEGQVHLESRAHYTHRTDDGRVVELKIGEAWRGKGDTMPGSCGGPLVSSNNKLQCPIIGIHVAAGQGQMLSKAICREMLEPCRQVSSQRISSVKFVSQRVNLGTKTKFRESPIHDLVKQRHEINYPAAMPNHLPESDVISVMLSKFSTPIYQEPNGYQEVAGFVCAKLSEYSGPTGRFLSIKEAVEGIDGLDHLDMNTSAGIPFAYKNKRKRDLIEVVNGVLEFKNGFEWDFNFLHYCINNNCGLDVVFMTCAKDELRPMEKVLLSKTRAIEASPLHFTLVLRQYWGSVMAHLQSNPGWHTSIAVGIDPDSDWHSLFESAVRFADVGIDLDFQNFDGSLSPFMVETGVSIMCELSGIDRMRTNLLKRELAYTTRQLDNMMFKVNGTLPSGMVATSLVNSIINQVNCYYVLSRCFKQKVWSVATMFRIICYGDDVMILVKRNSEIDVHQLCSMMEYQFSKIGLTVTSSTKGPVEPKPVLELEFLKRGVSMHGGVLYPMMSWKPIWSLLAWCRTNAEFKENIRNACWFVVLRGPKDFDEFYQHLKSMLELMRMEDHLPRKQYFTYRLASLEHTRDMDQPHWIQTQRLFRDEFRT
uniref:Genome polyprotein n=1 Tax=Hepeviridae sp. TaxID=2715178 RepID=A0A6M3YQ93_9VIRU|nr:MAG: polyprotein [Hepeviridae sp.]